MLDTIKNWTLDDEMDGLDDFGTHEEVGFEWTDLVKGLAGAAQGAGGLLSSQKPGTPANAEAEKQRLQKEKEEAQRSATTWKIVGGVGLGILALGGVALAVRR